ncbi:MAG: hypothetical protein QOI23_2004 [Chloroflexota bacterium]|jgi:hypothetical protein|nr:hypothetical protein [Chloroflexota bacterium]
MRSAAALALCVVLAACSLGGPTAPAIPVAGTTSTPQQAASAARITPPPVAPPAPPGTNVPAFKCADSAGGSAGIGNVTQARVGAQAGYDRLVLQFDTKVPAYTVKRQAKPTFKNGASGASLTLSGTAGVLVQVHSATMASSYSGTTDFTHPEFVVLNEARLIEDFEGYVLWGLGLSRPACMRTFTLSDPPRLVVDFASGSR